MLDIVITLHGEDSYILPLRVTDSQYNVLMHISERSKFWQRDNKYSPVLSIDVINAPITKGEPTCR